MIEVNSSSDEYSDDKSFSSLVSFASLVLSVSLADLFSCLILNLTFKLLELLVDSSLWMSSLILRFFKRDFFSVARLFVFIFSVFLFFGSCVTLRLSRSSALKSASSSSVSDVFDDASAIDSFDVL